MLAVYNTSTLEGIACIVYLLCDLDVYVYTLYTILSSGAYYGLRYSTVYAEVHSYHRDSSVINTGSAIYLEWNHCRWVIWTRFRADFIEFEHGQVSGLWGIQKIHTIPHFSTLYCTNANTIPPAAGPICTMTPTHRSVNHTFLHLLILSIYSHLL